MKNKIILFLGIIFTLIIVSCQPSKTFLVVSYNVENLFDTIQSSGLDVDFTPQGKKQYDTEKYNNKLLNLSKVIASIDSKQLPDIVGLIEVENRAVVEDLANQELLIKNKYRVSHFDGPDPRGIDVAMLYSNRFKLLEERPLPVYTDTLKRYRTRDILYVKGILAKDTLHVFVSHWKSRLGGAKKTERTRIIAAETLRYYVDSLLVRNSKSQLIIMGDFNDTPGDTAVYHVLGAKTLNTDAELINIMYPLYEENKGTYSYGGEFSMLDNIVISQSLVNKKRGLRTDGKGFIFSPEWICYETKKGELAPSRTYSGEKYYNGYSDHFPIYFYLKK
ncbi:MAG TPA: endonuclease [Salinivirgaceae bacterium]|nr:endonuclease [Salinivirgaceae bacterium]